MLQAWILNERSTDGTAKYVLTDGKVDNDNTIEVFDMIHNQILKNGDVVQPSMHRMGWNEPIDFDNPRRIDIKDLDNTIEFDWVKQLRTVDWIK